MHEANTSETAACTVTLIINKIERQLKIMFFLNYF